MPRFLLTPPAASPLAGNQILVSYNFQWYKFIAYGLQQQIYADVWDSPPADIDEQVDTLMELLSMPFVITYPNRVLLIPRLAKIVAGNNLTFTTVANDDFGGVWYQNTAAQNDEFEFQFLLNAGNYHLRTHGRTAANHGIVTWKIDGSTFVASDDYYSAATVENVERSHAVTIVGDGVHTLNAKVASKNASSSGYFHQHSWLKIEP